MSDLTLGDLGFHSRVSDAGSPEGVGILRDGRSLGKSNCRPSGRLDPVNTPAHFSTGRNCSRFDRSRQPGLTEAHYRGSAEVDRAPRDRNSFSGLRIRTSRTARAGISATMSLIGHSSPP